MDKSFWGDLVALAKAGYKPSDVKELLALGEKEQTGQTDDQETKEESEKKEETKTEKETLNAFEELLKKESK